MNEIQIDRIQDSIYCYCHVYQEYLEKNKPFILTKSFTESWPCRKIWVDDNGKPNWKYLKDNYGESLAPVANCNEIYFNSHTKSNWTLSDYIDYIIRYRESGYDSTIPCLYLKDWHFAQNLSVAPVYETPSFFTVDWLNEHWITKSKEDDYRFVYIGPSGSWTPFHSDVYGSFSWSANIVGKKQWIMFPPGEEEQLRQSNKILPRDLSDVDLSSVKHINLIQNEGEVIFVPSGWYHQVWNLEDTISINHNWFNGAILQHIHAALVKASEEIKAELRGFGVSEDNSSTEQLEVILNSHHGMNFHSFRQLLQTVVERRDAGLLRIHSFKRDLHCSDQHSMCNDKYHCSSDREKALKLLDCLLVNLPDV